LGTTLHRWMKEDETFEMAFGFTPAAPGLSLVRITADTQGSKPSTTDVVVSTPQDHARVFVYEPRPSWGAAFARQAVEEDPLFQVRALARTSRGVLTQTPGAPASLSHLGGDTADVILVGGLDALTEQDLVALRRFAADRGGTVVLVPDGRIPQKVSAAFDLPPLEEALLERPMELRQGPLRIRASEVLRIPAAPSSTDALLVSPLGKGQVIVGLALDGWRFRADSDGAFAQFWRAVAAEAAMAALPPVNTQLEPSRARVGEEVTLTVKVRDLGWGDELHLPHATAAMVSSSGESQPLRLWPGTSGDEYVCRFSAPAAGKYDVRVDLEGLGRHDVVLVTDADAVRPVRDRGRELAFLVEATGGAAFSVNEERRLRDSLHGLPASEEARVTHPTRSPWWVAIFATLVSAEWAIRRKRGLR
jgi:hypothetical protein